MILEKLHIIISIVAAIIMTIVCIIMKFSLVYSALLLVCTIIGFYIIGFFIKFFLDVKVFKKDEEILIDFDEDENPITSDDYAMRMNNDADLETETANDEE